MFESLTKHLPAIENAEGFGNWVVDRESKGTMNDPITMPYVNYGTTVVDVEQAIYDFVDEHPEYELTHYRDILERNGLEWGSQAMSGADVSELGGQAVMEGVMMMNKDRYSVAVRRPDGEIEVKVEQHKPLTKHKGLLKVPILRGVFSFADSMIVGMSSLMYSASFYEDEEEKKKPATKEEEEQQKAKKEKTDRLMMYGTVTFSVVIAVVLFLMVPYFLSELLHKAGAGTTLTAVAEAFVRVALFLGYLAAISRMEDIQRVFMYHGAEHKTVYCNEAGLELTPENAQTFYTLHPRCGTSFLMFVMVVAIIVHAFMGWPNVWLRMVTRLLVLPVIAGISYELLKWAGRSNNIIVEILSLPGLYLQKLTTKEPTLKQLEVAIASVKAVLNDGDDVPYFEGVCDLDGRPVEGEVRYYDPSKGDIKYEGPVGKAAEAAESAAQEADVSAAAPAENEVAKEEEA